MRKPTRGPVIAPMVVASKNSHSASRSEKGAKMENTVHDVVCGMDIDPNTAAGKSEYKGQTYYFCSPGCKRSFDKDPEKYVGAGAQTQQHS
jgi:YHS domain-containing protein